MPNQLSPKTEKLVRRYKSWYSSRKKEEETSTIHVDEVAAKAASFYEKIRKVVDWKEEHLMRKAAIERRLKRRFFVEEKKEIAKPLVHELIRAGYFSNDQIPTSKIEEVKRSLDKYLYIIQNSSKPKKETKIQLNDWFLSMAACEIEEILDPPIRQKASIDFMYENLKGRIKINEGAVAIKKISEEDKDTQLYIAIEKALFNLDDTLIGYHLLKRKFLGWKNYSDKKIKEITENAYEIRKDVYDKLNHPLGDKFYKIAKKYNTPFLLLNDILSDNPLENEEIIKNSEKLESLVTQKYNKRLGTLKKRLGRAAFYSTLSIFLTNILSLLALEIPISKMLTGSFNKIAILIDILGPTSLMFLLVSTVRTPKEGNLEQVILETSKITYENGKMGAIEIKPSRKRGAISNTIITLFYILTLSLFLGGVAFIFYYVKFPPFSYIINTIFLAVIAFTGVKIRERAKELTIIERKESFFTFIIDIFSLPILNLGKWFSNKWKKYNILSVIFNALIDMPFSTFINFLESWRSFLKEQKEKIH